MCIYSCLLMKCEWHAEENKDGDRHIGRDKIRYGIKGEARRQEQTRTLRLLRLSHSPIRGIPPGSDLGSAWYSRLWEGKIMPVGLVVSFFNQINHNLTENNFCLLMTSPAFEVPQGTASFEVCAVRSQLPSVSVCA